MHVENNYFLRPVPSSTVLRPFDATKFMKRLKTKGKLGWWQRFLVEVEEKRKEILHDLRMIKSAGS
jgi:hypothetical protein